MERNVQDGDFEWFDELIDMFFDERTVGEIFSSKDYPYAVIVTTHIKDPNTGEVDIKKLQAIARGYNAIVEGPYAIDGSIRIQFTNYKELIRFLDEPPEVEIRDDEWHQLEIKVDERFLLRLKLEQVLDRRDKGQMTEEDKQYLEKLLKDAKRKRREERKNEEKWKKERKKEAARIERQRFGLLNLHGVPERNIDFKSIKEYFNQYGATLHKNSDGKLVITFPNEEIERYLQNHPPKYVFEGREYPLTIITMPSEDVPEAIQAEDALPQTLQRLISSDSSASEREPEPAPEDAQDDPSIRRVPVSNVRTHTLPSFHDTGDDMEIDNDVTDMEIDESPPSRRAAASATPSRRAAASATPSRRASASAGPASASRPAASVSIEDWKEHWKNLAAPLTQRIQTAMRERNIPEVRKLTEKREQFITMINEPHGEEARRYIAQNPPPGSSTPGPAPVAQESDAAMAARLQEEINASNTEQCTVCQEDMNIALGQGWTLPCGDNFHIDCIRRHLLNQERGSIPLSCPNCREEIQRDYARDNLGLNINEEQSGEPEDPDYGEEKRVWEDGNEYTEDEFYDYYIDLEPNSDMTGRIGQRARARGRRRAKEEWELAGRLMAIPEEEGGRSPPRPAGTGGGKRSKRRKSKTRKRSIRRKSKTRKRSIRRKSKTRKRSIRRKSKTKKRSKRRNINTRKRSKRRNIIQK